MEKALINWLYTESQADSLRKIYNSADKSLIIKAISEELVNGRKFVGTQPVNQLFLICAGASFSESEMESVEVAKMLFYSILNNSNILPSLQDDKGYYFSAKCLATLSLFYPLFETKWRRYARPKASYYRDVAIVYLKDCNLNNIAAHFKLWENYLGETLSVEKIEVDFLPENDTIN